MWVYLYAFMTSCKSEILISILRREERFNKSNFVL